MRTVILSDLHLGNGGQYDIFAGGEELPALLDSFAQQPARVVLNGDTFDFLLNDDPLELDVSQAVRQAAALVAHPPTTNVMAALGRILRAGGEVLIVVGNHDLELTLPQVQVLLRNALQQPAHVARRLSFPVATEPLQVPVGGALVVITHGEQADAANRVDHEALHARIVAPSMPFRYPPGSLVVKALLNPLKARERMRYMDLLKPDVQGAVLTALAANPAAAKVVMTPDILRLVVRLLRNLGLPSAFSNDEEPSTLEGLGHRLSEAGLTQQEAEALANFLEDSGPLSFGEDDGLEGIRVKLVRAGLKVYAKLHRELLGQKGLDYFALKPEDSELAEARRLARQKGASAVVTGHTHSARWHEEAGCVFANTGTWIWLMRMPAPEASDEEWRDFLLELQDNPSLEESRQRLAKLEQHFTAVVVEPEPLGGATMRLAKWRNGKLHPLAQAALPATT